MRVLSLFDGISCARVACDRAGIPVEAYYASEIDKYAISISRKNWPDIIQLGNVTDINGLKFHGLNYPIIDLLIGGSPCQDLSIAKKDREGLSGSRSGLFYEYVRILNEVKPKYFILENVNSMPKEAKETITEELFGIEPIMINAALVSAQNRKRLFWVGKLVGDTYEQVNISLPEDRGILLRDILEDGSCDRLKSYCIDANYFKGGKIGGTHQSSTRNYTIRIGQFNKGGQGDSMVQEQSVIRKLTPIECERLQSLPDNYTEGVSNTQRYKALGNAFNVDVIAHILKNIK